MSSDREADEMVRGTISSDERRELRRAAVRWNTHLKVLLSNHPNLTPALARRIRASGASRYA